MPSRLLSWEPGALRYTHAAFFSAALLVALSAGVAQGKENPTPAPGQREPAAASTAPVRVQPNASEVTPPRHADVSVSDARRIDDLYRHLMGPDPDAQLGTARNEPTRSAR
jgi:hypothetical protein